MNIYCYRINGNYLERVGTCLDMLSLLWTRRFFKGDDFTIQLPPTTHNINLFAKGNVVELSRPGVVQNESNYCGIITNIELTDTRLTVKGKNFVGMLERRILAEYSVGDTVMNILDKNAGNQADEIRRFGATTFNLAESTDCTGLFAEPMRNKKLSEYVSAVGQFAFWGLDNAIVHNVIDVETGEKLPTHIVISGRYAVDRSVNQKTVKPVIFSDNFENATDFEYVYTENGAVTGAVITAPAQYDASKKIDVVAYNGYFGNVSGYGRIEKHAAVKASTKQEVRGIDEVWTVLDPAATWETANKIPDTLYANPSDCFDCRIISDVDWWRKFAVGDVVTIQNTAWNMSADKRVTEVQEFFDANNERITVTFGEPTKTLNEILKNK